MPSLVTGSSRPVVSAFPLAPKYDIVCMGDSLTKAYLYGANIGRNWPTQAMAMLQSLGALVRLRNFARSGNTTGPYTGESAVNGDMLARWGWMSQWSTPTIGILWGGVNDIAHLWNNGTAPTKGAWNTDTGTAFASTGLNCTVPSGHGTNYTTGQAIIIGTGASVQWTTLSAIGTGTGNGGGDLLTFGTAIVPPYSGSAQVSQGTRANLSYMIQALINMGCSKIIVINTHYINFASPSQASGDQMSGFVGGSAYSAGAFIGTLTPLASYAALRPYQAAAVSSGFGSGWGSASVVLCDLYSYFQRLIGNDATLQLKNGQSVSSGSMDVNGNLVTYLNQTYQINPNADSTPQFAANTQSYHCYNAGNNGIHQNELGHFLCAQFIVNTILAQQGWLTALQS